MWIGTVLVKFAEACQYKVFAQFWVPLGRSAAWVLAHTACWAYFTVMFPRTLLQKPELWNLHTYSDILGFCLESESAQNVLRNAGAQQIFSSVRTARVEVQSGSLADSAGLTDLKKECQWNFFILIKLTIRIFLTMTKQI